MFTLVAAVPKVASAHAALTQPAASKMLDVQVEAKLGEADELKLAASVREAIVERVRARKIDISDDAPASLLVTIGWNGKSRSDLEVKWALQEKGGQPEALKSTVCAACGSGEIIAAIDDDLAPLWAKIDAASTVEAAPAAVATPVTVPPPAAPASKEDRRGKRTTIGPLGFAGVAVGAVGIGAVAAGAVMWRVQYRYPEDNPDIRKNLEKPGIAIVAAGSALVIAGVAMTAIDLSRGKRSKSVAFAPAVDRRQVGAALAVRW
jgi:hypothetical protein